MRIKPEFAAHLLEQTEEGLHERSGAAHGEMDAPLALEVMIIE